MQVLTELKNPTIKTNELKRLNEWKCKKCSVTVNTVDNSDDTEIESESHDVGNLNVNVNVTDITLISMIECYLIPYD